VVIWDGRGRSSPIPAPDTRIRRGPSRASDLVAPPRANFSPAAGELCQLPMRTLMDLTHIEFFFFHA